MSDFIRQIAREVAVAMAGTDAPSGPQLHAAFRAEYAFSVAVHLDRLLAEHEEKARAAEDEVAQRAEDEYWEDRCRDLHPNGEHQCIVKKGEKHDIHSNGGEEW